ncbi:MAG: hypothetical protein AAGB35_09910 [Pseudomonadota bacterium]
MQIILYAILNFVLVITNASASDKKLFQWQATEAQEITAPLAKKMPSESYLTSHGDLVLPDDIQGKPFIIAVRDPDCPISRRYSPHLKKLQNEDIDIIYLLTGDLANEQNAYRDSQRYDLDAPYILDVDSKLSNWLGVRTSSEVYLFDENARLRYRGSIDDQFGIGFSRPKARNEFLIDAIRAVKAGLAVDIPVTSSPGCYVNSPVTRNVVRDLTWHKQVSRLMTEKCQVCHRVGQAAPFPLQTYEQVLQRRSMIRFVLNHHIMPPWFASGDAERWVGGRHLAMQDRQLIIDWIDSGAPEGNVRDAPAAYEWVDGWQLGKPDVVLNSPRKLNIPAEGEIAYEYVEFLTDFEEDRWVQALELSTAAPENTHHIIVFVLPPDHSSLTKSKNPSYRGRAPVSRKDLHLLAFTSFYVGYVQGLPGVRYQKGAAKLLPKGWRMLMQIHYEVNGVASTDEPRIGIQFAKQSPKKIIETMAVGTNKIKIPPGKSEYLINADHKFKKSGQIFGFFPHTHLRGKTFKYILKDPNGAEKVLLDVPRYNPNWQYYYQLKEPINVQAGSKLIASAQYDNSANNPNNPDPNAEVTFGLRTRDEMMVGYFDWVEDE